VDPNLIQILWEFADMFSSSLETFINISVILSSTVHLQHQQVYNLTLNLSFNGSCDFKWVNPTLTNLSHASAASRLRFGLVGTLSGFTTRFQSRAQRGLKPSLYIKRVGSRFGRWIGQHWSALVRIMSAFASSISHLGLTHHFSFLVPL
jgi:hypothetical protein